MSQIIEYPTVNPIQTRVKAFPTMETNLGRILNDPEHRRTLHAQLKKYNPAMVMLYRLGLLPLFGVARTVMLLTTRGNKSGKLRTTPIGYFRIGGEIHLFSAWGRTTGWYKNLRANPENLQIQIGLKKFPVLARELQDPQEILETLEQFIAESPSTAQSLFGWDPANDRLANADFSAIIQQVLIIHFSEKQKMAV